MRLHFLLILFWIILPIINCDGQDKKIRYQKVQQNYTIDPLNNTYHTQYMVSGTCKANTRNNVAIYFGELETIENIKATYSDLGKWKKVSKKQFVTSSVYTGSFYDGLKKTVIPYPKAIIDYPFKYSYEETTAELLFLARLNFSEADKVDTFNYKIELPLTHKLHYVIEDSLKVTDLVEVKEYIEDNKKIYVFNGIPKEGVVYPSTRAASVRLIITPNGKDPFDHYNDWYYHLVKPKAKLSAVNKQAIEEEVEGIDNDMDRIEKIFNLIKDRTSYIAIEDGIGAVQPRDVNKIYTAQQGDCKDMSNLLCESLRSLGYDAKIALSSTISHPFRLDFPSVSSANHAICVLNHDGKWLYMDATEDSGFFGLPSRQIQGRSVFVVDSDKGILKEVPKVSASENKVSHQLKLKKVENDLVGDILIDYAGLSQLEWRNPNKKYAENRLEVFLKKYLSTIAGNLIFDEVDLQIDETTCKILSKLSSNRNFTNIKDKTYLSLAFLPFPHEQYDDEEKTTVKFFKTVYNEYMVDVVFPEKIKLTPYTPIRLNEDGICFDFEIVQSDPNTLQVKYRFVNKMLELKDESLQSYREINKQVKKTLRKSIIYEKSE